MEPRKKTELQTLTGRGPAELSLPGLHTPSPVCACSNSHRLVGSSALNMSGQQRLNRQDRDCLKKSRREVGRKDIVQAYETSKKHSLNIFI